MPKSNAQTPTLAEPMDRLSLIKESARDQVDPANLNPAYGNCGFACFADDTE